MSILNDSSNFWNFYFWKKHCCCGNGGGTYQKSSRCIDRNGILFIPKLFRPIVKKIVLVFEKTLLKFKAEGREFAKSIEQFIQTVKGQNNSW